MRWLVVIVVACSSPREPARPTSVPADAAVVRDGFTAEAAVAPMASEPGDPAEPKPPEVECVFEHHVFCVPGPPTRTAMQPSPFEWCSRTQPSREQSVYQLDAQFSAAFTRARRRTQADACCYIDYFTRACD